MPTLFLHAGAPKTGTSFLQVLFARNAENLERDGIVYPKGHMFEEAKVGKITSGNGVEMANYIRPDLPHVIPDKEAFLGRFRWQLAHSGGKHVLYSSEYLVFEGDRAQRIAESAKNAGYAVRVVYFVRDLAPAAFSAYSQSLKRKGETRTFLEFLKAWDPLYQASIENAARVFGADSLLVKNYDECADRLAETMFRDILGAGFVPDDALIVNRSLSPKETELQRLMNMTSPGNPRYSMFISETLMKISHGREPIGLTPAETELLEGRMRPAVDYVNRFVIGRPTVIAATVEARPEMVLSDFERAMVAIVGALVHAVTK
jgi:hypothetical protein